MKKVILLLLALSLLMLAGCKCEHKWEDATCLEPQICASCKETKGEPLGHSWKAATCEAPKTCEVCGATEGEALSHNYTPATCEQPQTCADCGYTEGVALGHTWQDATYEDPMTCTACAATQGDVLKRTDLGNTKEEMEQGLGLTMQVLGYQMQFLGYDQDGWPAYALLDAATGKDSGVEVYFEPTQDNTKVYGILIATENVNDPAAGALMGAVASATAVGIEPNFDIQAFTQTLQGQPETMPDGGLLYQMDSCGIVLEMQVYTDLALIWVYPVPVE